MRPCPPGTRARGSWGARTPSRGSRRVLDDATGGRARAMLIERPGRRRGQPVHRRGDRAHRRAHRADARPARRGVPAGTDEPYGPIVRALGRRSTPCRTTSSTPSSARPRRASPRSCRARGPAGPRPAGCRRTARRRARTPPGARARGRPRHARPAWRAAARRARPRGPPSRRCRDPCAGHVPRPDRPDQRLAHRRHVPAGHRPPRRPVDQRPRVARGGAAAPERLALPPLDRDDLARAHRGDRGRTRVGQPAARWSPSAPAGSPLVAEELLAARRELPTASLTCSFEDLVMARLAVRSPECRRVLRLLAPAGPAARPGAARRGRRRLRGRDDRAAPRSSSGPRRGDGVLDADLAAGLDEGIEHGFLVERDGPSACATS